VSQLATVIARPWECWRLLSGRRSRHSLPWSRWSRWIWACRRYWEPLALPRLLLLLRTRQVLLLSRLVQLKWPLLRVLVPRPSVATRRNRSHLPLLVLNLPALALGVEGGVNQMVEVVEVVVQELVLNVIVQPLPEALLLIAIIGDLSGGVASELEETITVLGHRHSSLKLLNISYFTEVNKGGLELKRSCGKILL
jgi:hypothetical protein